MKNEDLRDYRMFGLTLLQFMTLLGVSALVLTFVLTYFA